MGEQDIQVKIGLTLDGVKKTETTAARAVTKSSRAKVQAEKAMAQANLAEARVKSVQTEVLRQIGRFAIAGAMTQGIEALTPNIDNTAMGFLRSLGTNISMNSYLLQSLSAGVVVGVMVSALQGVTSVVQHIQGLVEEDEKRILAMEENLTKLRDGLDTAVEQIRRNFEKEVGKIRERDYVFFRQTSGAE